MLVELSPILPCSTVITLPRVTPFNIAKFARQNGDRVTASSAATMKGASAERKQEQVELSELFELKMNVVDSKFEKCLWPSHSSHMFSVN